MTAQNNDSSVGVGDNVTTQVTNPQSNDNVQGLDFSYPTAGGADSSQSSQPQPAQAQATATQPQPVQPSVSRQPASEQQTQDAGSIQSQTQPQDASDAVTQQDTKQSQTMSQLPASPAQQVQSPQQNPAQTGIVDLGVAGVSPAPTESQQAVSPETSDKDTVSTEQRSSQSPLKAITNKLTGLIKDNTGNQKQIAEESKKGKDLTDVQSDTTVPSTPSTEAASHEEKPVDVMESQSSTSSMEGKNLASDQGSTPVQNVSQEVGSLSSQSAKQNLSPTLTSEDISSSDDIPAVVPNDEASTATPVNEQESSAHQANDNALDNRASAGPVFVNADLPTEHVSSQPTQEQGHQASPSQSHSVFNGSMLSLLAQVVKRDASDLHITVGYPPMLRIDGELVPVSDGIVTEQVASDLILSVLPDNKKELLEINREVDLAYQTAEGNRFRINAYYQQGSVAAAFRLIPQKIRTIDELNLPPIYHQFAKLGQGLVLVTGPTGHGKSTTLAAILQEINETRAVHLITIEDPIEYVFPKAKALVDQREMHDDTHSWKIALKSAMREDPDVVLVGEMRDFETIGAAITLAETGHLVFATLHTNNAAQSIARIIDVFPEHQQAQVRSQLADILEAVVAQRLVPIQGGGRRAASEIMIATSAVRNLIRENKTNQIDNVIRTSADIGMISLEKSLVKLVRDGLITMDVAKQYAPHPEEVMRLLKG